MKRILLVLVLIFGGVQLQAKSKDKLAITLKTLTAKTKDSIIVAKKFLGTRYIYGKWDCSKFVQKVMKKSKNKNLPRTTRQQIKIGKNIRKNNARKGDLIFFGDLSHRVGHVGIILDPKKMLMIHNSSAKGKVVISNYNTKYYRKKFRGIRRTWVSTHTFIKIL